MEKHKEFLENFQTIHQEIKNYYSILDMKYDEFGKRHESESKVGSYLGVLLDKIVSKSPKKKD